jgi:hypothetical protein
MLAFNIKAKLEIFFSKIFCDISSKNNFLNLAFNIRAKLEMFKNNPLLFKFKKLAFNIKAKLEIFFSKIFYDISSKNNFLNLAFNIKNWKCLKTIHYYLI